MSAARAVAPPIAVSLRDLHKSFGALKVLKGISLTAREGEVVSILGASGSGKSTLLRCISTCSRSRCRRDRRRRRDGPPRPHPARRDATGRAGADCAAALAHRHGIPELQPVVAQDDPRERHRGADPRPEAAVHRLRRRGRGAARQGRYRREAKPLPRPPLRRAAAARGDRPRPRHAPGAHAVRRADLGARSRARRRGAARHARPRRGGAHDAGRDP
jgi:energy-coupling factor transporter ATP-binding protein EcfA2